MTSEDDAERPQLLRLSWTEVVDLAENLPTRRLLATSGTTNSQWCKTPTTTTALQIHSHSYKCFYNTADFFPYKCRSANDVKCQAILLHDSMNERLQTLSHSQTEPTTLFVRSTDKQFSPRNSNLSLLTQQPTVHQLEVQTSSVAVSSCCGNWQFKRWPAAGLHLFEIHFYLRAHQIHTTLARVDHLQTQTRPSSHEWPTIIFEILINSVNLTAFVLCPVIMLMKLAAAQRLAQMFISCLLDYCNSLLYSVWKPDAEGQACTEFNYSTTLNTRITHKSNWKLSNELVCWSVQCGIT